MKEIGLIGATSPLGVNLITHLVKEDYRIFAGYRSNSRIPLELLNHPAIDWIKTDLSKKVEWQNFCRENVIWLAHLNQGRYNNQEMKSNLEPFKAFLKQFKDSSDKKLVFISSGGSVYGNPLFLPITEEHLRQPLSSYGRTKKALEDEICELSQNSNIKTAVIRPANIYGFERPDKESKGIVASFLNSIRNKTSFTLIHKGQTIRDFVYVDDVSRAVVSAIKNDQPNIIWNVGTGKGRKIVEVLEMIIRISKFEKPEIIQLENYSSDVAANVLSIDRITSESDWFPEITIEEGLKRVIDNWLNYAE